VWISVLLWSLEFMGGKNTVAMGLRVEKNWLSEKWGRGGCGEKETYSGNKQPVRKEN